MKTIETNNLIEDVNLLTEISCSCCGGKFISSNCNHCDTYDEKADKINSSIENKLSEIEKILEQEQAIIPAEFIEIYKIKGNKKVATFLDDYKVDDYVNNIINGLMGKLSKLEPLTKEEDKYLKHSFAHFLDTQKQNYILDITNLSVVKNNPTVSEETLCEIWQTSLSKVTKEHNYLIKTNTKANLPNNTAGNYGKRELNINRQSIHNLYTNPNIEVKIDTFDTYYHELTHLIQDNRRRNKDELSNLGMLQLKEHILSRTVPNFYNDNYNIISTEVEARAFGEALSFGYVSSLLGVPMDLEQNKKAIITNLNNDNNQRLFNGEMKDIHKQFSIFIKDKPSLLKTHPKLQNEFTIDNNEVRIKTPQEIIDTVTIDTSNQEATSYYNTILTRSNNEMQNQMKSTYDDNVTK